MKMTSEQAQLLLLKGAITDLPLESQQKVQEAKEKLSAIIKDFGDEGRVALALVGMEIAAADGEKP